MRLKHDLMIIPNITSLQNHAMQTYHATVKENKAARYLPCILRVRHSLGGEKTQVSTPVGRGLCNTFLCTTSLLIHDLHCL